MQLQHGRQERAHLEDIIREVLWVRGGETNAHLWIDTSHCIQQLCKLHSSTPLWFVHTLEALH